MNQLGISKQDIEFLKELQHELLTQDHICQASPRFWVVQGTVRQYGIDSDYDCNGSELIWDTERFAEDVDEAMKKLKDEYYDIFQDKSIAIRKRDGYWQFSEDRGDNIITIFDLDDIKDFMEDKLGYDNVDVVNYRNIDKNFENTMFLTNRECKAHIKANYYHYPKDAHSYAMTAWRSPEVSKVWNILEKINCDELLKIAE